MALITGGAQRLGRAIVLALARAGYDVAFTYHNSQAPARSLVQELRAMGRQAVAWRVDLSRPEAAQQVREMLLQRFSRLDVLVNNAAAYPATPWGRLTSAQFDAVLALNARAPVLLTQQLSPLLRAQARAAKPETLGRVVNLLDMHALGQHRPGYLAYTMSKAALHAATLTLARELAPRVTVNAVAPGVAAWHDSFPPAQRKKYLERVPLGRAGTPEDIAAAVLYLCRDAHYTTGQVLTVDGGRSLT